MRNVEFASEICKGLLDWQKSTYKNDPLIHPLPHLYHLVWQLVVPFHYPEFRRPLCAASKGLSSGSLETYGWLVTYICGRSPIEAVWAHAIRDLEAERESGDDKPNATAALQEILGFGVRCLLETRV